MEYKDVIYEKKNGRAYLIMNRPEKHNALRFEMFEELVDALKRAEDDDDVKVIILKGNGPSFCSGHDLTQVGFVYGFTEGRTEEERKKRPNQRVRLLFDRKMIVERYMAFQYSMKPIIAQVHGYCIGAGLFLVELVDLAICADDTHFSHAEQRLAFSGNTWQLEAEILTYGPKKCRELLLMGMPFNGPDAVQMGVANKSVPKEKLEDTVEEWAEIVMRNPKDALVMGKTMWQMALDNLGYTQQLWRGYMGHTMATSIKFEPDEYNFFKARRDEGAKRGFHGRDEYFERPVEIKKE